MTIPILDLKGQYRKIKEEIDSAILEVLAGTNFINGKEVGAFEKELALFLGSRHVIGCANGTDALQMAMMALELKPGDEVIVPAFTYAATAEVIGLLGLTPVLVDVDPLTFNIKAEDIEASVTEKTKAVVPVHLFGQACDMEKIEKTALKYGLYVIEDNAQALGSVYTYGNGKSVAAGTIGEIGCTSFFPTKNLGCYGDGGAVFTQSDELASRIRMIADHGQKVKYYHDIIGVNSRLDTIQAAVLLIKLKHLKEYSSSRYACAQRYKELLSGVDEIILPYESVSSTHVYHQFTVRTSERDRLKQYLADKGISSMIYYPMPLSKQKAFSRISKIRVSLAGSEAVASEVLSLPMHTELTEEIQKAVCDAIKEFFSKHK
jgi:dTDP-4-amino-4,6-dideoxygalactose transaminase